MKILFWKTRLLLIFSGLMALALFWPTHAPAQQVNQVLVLHSYHHGLTWTDSEDEGIRSVLRPRTGDIEVHTEYMDTKTIADSGYFGRYFQLLKQKYAHIPFKVVIANDDDAYNFYLRYHDRLFPGVPMVFCGVNYFKDADRMGREDLITGVVEAFDIPDTLHTALRLHPATKRVVVINDRSTTGLANKRLLNEAVLPEFQKKVKFEFWEDLTMPDLLRKVKTLSDGDIILLLTFNRDRAGAVFNYDQSIALIAKAATVPIYGVWDFYLGKGIVGGMLTSGVDQGRIAAQMALRILDGEQVRNIPVVKESPNRYKFDYTQMKRFDITKSELPAGSMVINEPVSFYRQHKRLVWGTLAGFLGLAVIIMLLLANIRQRRLGEHALRKSEEKYRSLVNNLNVGVFRNSGGPRGTCIQANPAMARIFGYGSVEEFMKVPVSALYQYPEDREKYVNELSELGAVKDKELALRKKDGTPIWCSVTATAHYDETGHVLWLDSVLEDITDRKRLEAQLLQSQKMDAIGQLSGGIAHDFNNILTAVMGYASLLKTKTTRDPLLQSYVDQVLSASARARSLTQNLLAFSRKQELHPIPLQVNEIINGIERMLVKLVREDIEFKTVLAKEEMTILADRGQIEQVLINLVTNARDAMPQGGTLLIETKKVELTEESAKKYLVPRQGNFACIAVSDTGMGMDERTKQRLFEPFFTTKELGKGTGLGLSIVYGIVKQHNGEISVYSEPGSGTTFRVYFPLVATTASQEQKRDLPAPRGGSETLLLAEDDADVRNLTKTILTEAGYKVLEATDGDEALKVFSEHKDTIQLVLLDVIMPKKNGKEVHNRIKRIHPDAKVLFMSGYAPDIIFKDAHEEGLNLITKPSTPHELLRKIRELIDQKIEHHDVRPEHQAETAATKAGFFDASAKQAAVFRKHEGSVIVVDDDPHVLEYMSLLLDQQGYLTYACNNAHDAMERLKERQADVILSDIVMPGMSGLELLENVHAIDADMPVVLVTAFADLGKAVESIKKGAYDFIMKPYDPEQLIRSLDKAIRYRKLVRFEQEYKDKLEEFNKEMETLVAERSMNLMALTVADRVRNPATVIALACNKILGKKIPNDLQKYVNFIRDESGKLEAMVKSFHDLLASRRSVFGYEDVNELVKSVVSLVKKEAEAKGIVLKLRLSDGPLEINMQKNLLRVAIQHVLRNAIEATSSGGSISIITEKVKDNVSVVIHDTGSGIPEEDEDKIFDPFYSTKAHRYGMGLPLVKQVVTEHMGKIELSSKPREGTVFRMIFPTQWHEQ